MGYRPFLIAPFKTGLDTDVEPWLLPEDAFSNICNGHIHHGFIQKRSGYRFLAEMVHGRAITAASNAATAVFTVASTSGMANGDSVSLHYLAGGTWANLNEAKYTLASVTATTFTLIYSTGAAVDGSGFGAYTASSGRLGTFEDVVSSATITAATTANPAVFTSVVSVEDGDTVVLKGLLGGTWATLDDESYTVTGLAGTSFSLIDSSGTTVDGSGLGVYTGSTGTAEAISRLRIMGIFNYIGSDNTRETLVADTKRVSIYNSATNLLDPLDLFDITSTLQTNNDVFSSSDTDYIWSANWQHAGSINRVYFTNGKAYQPGAPGTDGILYYDASNPRVEQFQPSLNATDDLYGCKLIFSIRQRLLCLHTFEFDGATTNTFPQRARWCAGQDPSNWNDTVAGGGGFVDAPTGEQIISARLLQDIIIVHFTDSVWTLRPVPDPALPFRWDKINDFRACDGKMATVGFDRYSVGVGVRGITATDGVETRRVDDRIEDFVINEINDSQFDKVFVSRSYAKRRTWFLYPSVESDDADGALIFDDESGAYSTYKINMNVLGYGNVSQDFAAQDFIAANDLDVSAFELNDETALSYFWSQSAELFLGGDREGKVHILETVNTDDGTMIPFCMKSAAWNPFKDQGVEAQLGYIDFYLDADQQTKFEVEFFKNTEEDPYTSQGMDALPNLNFRSVVADVVINSDPTTGFLVTSNSHGLIEGNTFYFYGIEGAVWQNDRKWTVGSTVTENTFSVDTDITSFGSAITGITQANPAVVTSVAHDFSNGDKIYITAVTGMTEVNNLSYTVSNITTDTYELQGIDSTGFTAYVGPSGYAHKDYVSGGQIFEREFFRTKVWKRAYAGGIGFQHRMSIASDGSNEPVKIHAIKLWMKPRGKRTLG